MVNRMEEKRSRHCRKGMRFGLNWRGPWIKYRACSIGLKSGTHDIFKWWRRYVSHYIFICVSLFGSCFSLLLHERDKYLLKERDFILYGNQPCYNFHMIYFPFFFSLLIFYISHKILYERIEKYLKKNVWNS